MKKIILFVVIFIFGIFVNYDQKGFSIEKLQKEDNGFYEGKVVFLDVGQGDSILINFGNKNIIIDGGPDANSVHRLRKYLHPYNNNWDLLILTHPHGDHIEGFYDFYYRYKIKSVINKVEYERTDWNYFLYNEKYINYEKFLNKCLFWNNYYDEDYEVLELKNALSYANKNQNGIFFCFVFPMDVDEKFSNINSSSIVNLLFTNEKVFWLMGDAEIDVESKILERYSKLEFNNREVILKAGHHCSKTSSSQDFLEFVSPDLIICSVGKDNKYGHPSPEIIDLFNKEGFKYFLTMEQGDILVEF